MPNEKTSLITKKKAPATFANFLKGSSVIT